ILAEHYDNAADLIEEHGVHIFWEFHEWVRLHRWLDQLPRDLIYDRPILCCAYGWAYLLTGKPEEMPFYIEAAENALPAVGDSDIIGEIQALKAEYALITGYFERALEYASDALSYL